MKEKEEAEEKNGKKSGKICCNNCLRQFRRTLRCIRVSDISDPILYLLSQVSPRSHSM